MDLDLCLRFLSVLGLVLACALFLSIIVVGFGMYLKVVK